MSYDSMSITDNWRAYQAGDVAAVKAFTQLKQNGYNWYERLWTVGDTRVTSSRRSGFLPARLGNAVLGRIEKAVAEPLYAVAIMRRKMGVRVARALRRI